MATEKVGIYRKYHGPIPKDKSGQLVPKNDWPKKRAFRWAVRWFGTEGKRYSKSFKTRREAERFAEIKQPDVRSGKANPPPKITLKHYYDEHRELMKGNLAASTLQMHLRTLRLLAYHAGWSLQIRKIRPRDIEGFRATRLKTGISPSSANREVRTLKRLFNIAIARDYIAKESNPCNVISLIKVTPKKPRYCSPKEFSAIYQLAPDTYWKTLLTTVYTTGVRLRELLNLTWSDIDFQKEQLHITRKSRTEWIQPWQPKDHEIRTIPLPKQAVDLLKAWQSISPKECPYVFIVQERWDYYCKQVSKKKWREGQDLVNNVLRRFKTLCRKVSLPKYSIHDLRRSCITNWAKHLPIHVVQQLAGHSDIRTTQKYYLSVQEEDIKKAQQVQTMLLGEIPASDLTDPKVTHSGRKRAFPGRKTNRVDL
jgi:integrase